MRQVPHLAPHLGLLARLGFVTAAVVALAVGAIWLKSRLDRPPLPRSAQAAATRSPTSDITGSIPTAQSHIAQGPVSGLPMPRFVSIKTGRVNVRQGPTREHAVAFVFQRSGLPVEVIAEFENWRKIRDYDGTEGWILHSLLSGKRTALVAPWSRQKTLPLYADADTHGQTVALLEPKVQAQVRECAGQWCRIKGQGFEGWIQQDRLWGAYPGERFD